MPCFVLYFSIICHKCFLWPCFLKHLMGSHNEKLKFSWSLEIKVWCIVRTCCNLKNSGQKALLSRLSCKNNLFFASFLMSDIANALTHDCFVYNAVFIRGLSEIEHWRLNFELNSHLFSLNLWVSVVWSQSQEPDLGHNFILTKCAVTIFHLISWHGRKLKIAQRCQCVFKWKFVYREEYTVLLVDIYFTLRTSVSSSYWKALEWLLSYI